MHKNVKHVPRQVCGDTKEKGKWAPEQPSPEGKTDGQQLARLLTVAPCCNKDTMTWKAYVHVHSVVGTPFTVESLISLALLGENDVIFSLSPQPLPLRPEGDLIGLCPPSRMTTMIQGGGPPRPHFSSSSKVSSASLGKVINLRKSPPPLPPPSHHITSHHASRTNRGQ